MKISLYSKEIIESGTGIPLIEPRHWWWDEESAWRCGCDEEYLSTRCGELQVNREQEEGRNKFALKLQPRIAEKRMIQSLRASTL